MTNSSLNVEKLKIKTLKPLITCHTNVKYYDLTDENLQTTTLVSVLYNDRPLVVKFLDYTSKTHNKPVSFVQLFDNGALVYQRDREDDKYFENLAVRIIEDYLNTSILFIPTQPHNTIEGRG
jgi:hypothetical protein